MKDKTILLNYINIMKVKMVIIIIMYMNGFNLFLTIINQQNGIKK